MAEESVAVNDGGSLIRPDRRQGDVISPHRAVLTLSKSMFNAGCFSLPFAWSLGGKWMSFVLTIAIAGFNWYGNHILVRSSQHLAQKYVVNVTILFYQLGMCSVAILFISDNMVHLLGNFVGGSDHFQTIVMASIATVFILGTNMFTEMRVISIFAMISSVFFLMGTVVIMQYTIQQPSQWDTLPSYTNFTSTIIFIGMSMYAFEGQTMVFMMAIGFYGYNGFGDNIKSTITVNVPRTGFYSVVNVFLMIQSILGHSIAMYVVFDMFFKGFRRKFQTRFPSAPLTFVDKGFRCFWVLVTYFMAILIPKLELLIPLVGVTSGTLCALVYPPLFQTITFWDDWKTSLTPTRRALKIGLNFSIVLLGFFAIGAGLTADLLQFV